MKEQILHTAFRLFTSQGIQPFTMDDIAAKMAISKKTLYRFYDSRQHLIEEVCRHLETRYANAFATADEQKSDSLQRVLAYMNTNLQFCKKLNPAFFSDLYKHYPQLANNLVTSLRATAYQRLLKELEQGIAAGLFRGSVHPALVVAILQQHMQKDFEFAAELVNDYAKDEVFRQAMYLFLYGIIAPHAIPQLEAALGNEMIHNGVGQSNDA